MFADEMVTLCKNNTPSIMHFEYQICNNAKYNRAKNWEHIEIEFPPSFPGLCIIVAPVVKSYVSAENCIFELNIS